MGEISKWLLHDDQKALFEFLVVGVLNATFLGLVGLLLWPMDRLGLALRLAQGYGLLWIVTLIVFLLTGQIQKLLRVDLDGRANAFVFSNLGVSCLLQVSWSAFAAFTLREAIGDASTVIGIILYATGIISCFVACLVIGAFYQGTLYRLVNLLVALIGFLTFSLWPAGEGLPLFISTL